MPKSHMRYKQMDMRGSSCSGTIDVQLGLIRMSLLLSAPPRKVSFEDSRYDSNPSIRSDDTFPTPKNKKKPASETAESEQKKRPPIRRKRSLLVRPTTSLSLVSLTNSVAHDGVSSMISGQSNTDQIERKKSKRVCSFNLSPRSIVPTTDLSDVNQQHLCSLQVSSEGESKSIRKSLWGHFIDMSPDEDDYDNLPVTAYPNYDDTLESNRRRASRCSSKETLCRTRRRPSPYGEFKSYTTREAQPTLSFVELRTDSKSKGNYRLSPRSKNRNQESADDLICVFSELRVQHMRQKIT